jgi:hypothetical protein
MAANAAFAATPRYEIAIADTANTNYDGTGAITTLFTAGANGSRVDAVGWQAQGSTTEGVIHFYFRKSENDTWRFIFGWNYPGATTSATVHPTGWGVSNLGITLTAGAQIGFAISTATSPWAVHVSQAGDF